MDRFFVGPLFALTHELPSMPILLVLHALYILALWPTFWLALRLFALVTRQPPTGALRRAFIGTLAVAVFFVLPTLLIAFAILRGLLWLAVRVVGWVRRQEPSTPRWAPWAVGVVAMVFALSVPT